MSLAFLATSALAALAALAIPLLIHLARRPELHTLDFAALRWIRARHRPQRRLTLEERGLLALRLLLLALLALYLAQPVLRDAPDPGAWIVVIPGADLPAARASSPPGEAAWRWLAPGFPPLDTPAPPARDIASLLRSLDATLPAATTLAVVAPATLAGLDGERVHLGRDLEWRIVPGVAAIPARPAAPRPRLALRHGGDRGEAARSLQAVTEAWRAARPDVAAAQSLPAGDTDTLFWLHAGTVPVELREWTAAGHTLVIEPGSTLGEEVELAAVVAWRDAAGTPLATAQPLGSGRVLRLLQPLRPDALPQLLDPGFPTMLQALLQPPDAPRAAPAETQRPLRAAAASDGALTAAAARPLQPWLAALIALLALLERAVASRARRWAA
jgi:hypothetical protein